MHVASCCSWALLPEMRASGDRALRSVLRLAPVHERVLCERLELRQRRAWRAHSVSRTSDACSRGPGRSASAGDRWRVAAPAADRGSGCLRRPERPAAPWLPCARPPRVAALELLRAARPDSEIGGVRCPTLAHATLPLTPTCAGRAEAYREDVAARLRALAAARGEPPPEPGNVVAAAARLGAQRVLLVDAGGRRLRMRLALNVAPADAALALRGAATAAAIPWLAQVELL